MPAEKIIVAEDDTDIRYVLCEHLRAAGFDPLEAEDGLDALKLMATHPDCRRMISDFCMPRVGGEVWVRLLERFCPDWSIVIVSGEDIDSGLFVLSPKPIDIPNIITHLRREAA